MQAGLSLACAIPQLNKFDSVKCLFLRCPLNTTKSVSRTVIVFKSLPMNKRLNNDSKMKTEIKDFELQLQLARLLAWVQQAYCFIITLICVMSVLDIDV